MPRAEDARTLFEGLKRFLSEPDETKAELPPPDPAAAASLSAALEAALDDDERPGAELSSAERAAIVAALHDGRLDPAKRQAFLTGLAASPEEFHSAISSFAFLETVEATRSKAPADLVEMAVLGWSTKDAAPSAIAPSSAPGRHSVALRQRWDRWSRPLHSIQTLRWSGALATAALLIAVGLTKGGLLNRGDQSAGGMVPQLRGSPVAVEPEAVRKLLAQEVTAAAALAAKETFAARHLSDLATQQQLRARSMALVHDPAAEAATTQAAGATRRANEAEQQAARARKTAALLRAEAASQSRLAAPAQK